MKTWSKSDIYNDVIDITKATGQGLAGFVIDRIPNGWTMVNELIEEGLLKKYVTTFPATGMPPAIFVSLEGDTYCVEKDEKENGNKHALSFMRYYLKIGDGTEFGGKINLSDVIDHNIEKYRDWVYENLIGLETIKNLKHVQLGDDIPYEVKEYIKTRSWYKENKPVSEVIEANEDVIDNRTQKIGILKELIKLETGDPKYVEDCKKHEIELEEEKNTLDLRYKIKSVLDRCNDTTMLIQDFLNTFEKSTLEELENLPIS